MKKHYTTNYLVSVAFYFVWVWPIVIVIITIPMIRDLKNTWPAMLVFYPVCIFLEFLAIKYMRKDIVIDDEGITITSSQHVQKAHWSDIVELKEYLFGQGELFYDLIAKDKKKVGFTSSLKNIDDLLHEIETRTGLKFKQRL